MGHGWHVVLGAGPLGLAVAGWLTRQGRLVRLACRSGPAGLPGVECVKMDASDADGVRRLCEAAEVLYFCARPPAGSPETLVLMVQGLVAGLSRAGCRLVYADTFLAYGPVEGPYAEGMPHRPIGPEGRARAAAAAHVLETHRLERLGVDVVRAADFFGPGVTGGWLGERVFVPAMRGGSIYLPAAPEARHGFAYVNDFARTMVGIGGEAGSFGQVWHVPPLMPLSNRELMGKIVELAGTEASCHFIPGWLEALYCVLSKSGRSGRESAFLRDRPVVVESVRLTDRFGFEATPIDEAIERTLDWYRARMKGGK